MPPTSIRKPWTWFAPARETFGFDVIVDDADKVLDHQDVFGVLLRRGGHHRRNPRLQQTDRRAESAHKVIVSVAADFMALVLPLTAPGKQGADIVFGSAQRFGVPMGYGGPHAAFFAAKMNSNAHAGPGLSAYRKMRRGIPRCAWRCGLASSTSAVRKRTPTFVPSQVLLANIASLYAVFHGPAGLKRIRWPHSSV
ncbi:hypothetical protein LNP74_07355 [Klebsiella pneumoniae subsp. pneumoniae]|nr:hypothetical protein [Klebsiella pneumoniae subsp. pneumoniae]